MVMIPQTKPTTITGYTMRSQVERLLADVEHEISERQGRMMVYDSSIDALIEIRERLVLVLGDEGWR